MTLDRRGWLELRRRPRRRPSTRRCCCPTRFTSALHRQPRRHRRAVGLPHGLARAAADARGSAAVRAASGRSTTSSSCDALGFPNGPAEPRLLGARASARDAARAALTRSRLGRLGRRSSRSRLARRTAAPSAGRRNRSRRWRRDLAADGVQRGDGRQRGRSRRRADVEVAAAEPRSSHSDRQDRSGDARRRARPLPHARDERFGRDALGGGRRHCR